VEEIGHVHSPLPDRTAELTVESLERTPGSVRARGTAEEEC